MTCMWSSDSSRLLQLFTAPRVISLAVAIEKGLMNKSSNIQLFLWIGFSEQTGDSNIGVSDAGSTGSAPMSAHIRTFMH